MFRSEKEVSMSRAVRWAVPLVAVSAVVAMSAAFARSGDSTVSRESGSALYGSYCASCHGKEGKGDGPIAANLRTAPADLTLIARRNHGKFDGEKVRAAIDGRGPKQVHGGSDMPVWGDAFKRAGDSYSEAAVKERIDALVDYLADIQEK
jgi:mono/diheme cytochrome c family protein